MIDKLAVTSLASHSRMTFNGYSVPECKHHSVANDKKRSYTVYAGTGKMTPKIGHSGRDTPEVGWSSGGVKLDGLCERPSSFSLYKKREGWHRHQPSLSVDSYSGIISSYATTSEQIYNYENDYGYIGHNIE